MYKILIKTKRKSVSGKNLTVNNEMYYPIDILSIAICIVRNRAKRAQKWNLFNLNAFGDSSNTLMYNPK